MTFSELLVVVTAGMTVAAALPAYAQDDADGNYQPYIDKLMKKNHIAPAKPEPDSAEPDLTPIRRSAPSRQQTQNPAEAGTADDVQPYIQKLLNNDRASGVDKSSASLANPADAEAQPYIETIKEKKDLEPKFKGTVNQAAGFSIVASNTFNITSTEVQANPFNAVYNPQNKYAPSGDIFYEREVYRSTTLGAVGVVGHLNVITISGTGLFTNLPGTPQSLTQFKFYALPFTVAGEYRFLQLRWVQPYFQLGAVGIPYFETRTDGFPTRRGISRGFNATPGVAINLDWISRSSAWAQYEDSSVLHTYLLAQMEFLRPISGAVSFNYTGLYFGLMFEF